MLYIIPTPIGNREDITLRALRLFKELKVFFCEDTRTFKKLLNMYEIDYQDKNFYSLTTFTSKWRLNNYLDIFSSQDVWLVSEAWTPWLSDPGKELVRIVWENNIEFEVLPWANALIPAVVWAGFDTSAFVFLGFLHKKKWKNKQLQFIKDSEIPVFIYESVYRVDKTLQELKAIWFDGKVMLCRELTKKFQQLECGHIDEILSKLSKSKISAKWEFVLWFSN